jgi:hypothetical protein
MRAKLTEWSRRYLPLEIVATLFALVGGLCVAGLTDNSVVIAYAATWAENLGFYGFALIREARVRFGETPVTGASTVPVLAASCKQLALEFGPAELVDSFLLRPACMYFLPTLIGDLAMGLLAGKLIADFAFYGMAIAAYEWGKRRRSP